VYFRADAIAEPLLREGGDGDFDPESFLQLNGCSALHEFTHDANLGEASVHRIWNRWVRAAAPNLKEVSKRCKRLVWSFNVELTVWVVRVQPVHAVLANSDVWWNFGGASIW
jgi:hypothetical protein